MAAVVGIWDHHFQGVTMRGLLTVAMTLGLALSAAAQDSVKQRLEKSPRHHEWAVVKNGQRQVHCFLVFPEVKNKATAVLVIHENKGLTDWVRGVADQVAEAGYLAIAPDLLSGLGPKGGKTEDFPSLDAATKALYTLDPQQVTGDLSATADYVLKLPACNGKLTVAGFCWGGGQTMRFATNRKDIKAACVFYGATELTPEAVARIQTPVYGFYGSNDARINMTIKPTVELMKNAGKTYEPVIYEGAGHGFMRAGEEMPSGANGEARKAGWERWKMLLKKV
jgi:carboxymethylenebutenolidase